MVKSMVNTAENAGGVFKMHGLDALQIERLFSPMEQRLQAVLQSAVIVLVLDYRLPVGVQLGAKTTQRGLGQFASVGAFAPLLTGETQ